MTLHDPTRRQFLQAAAATTAGLAATSTLARAADSELPYGIVDVLDSDPATGMSAAVIVGDVPLVHTEQRGNKELPAQLPIAPFDDMKWLTDHLAASIDELAAALKLAGSSLEHVVKFNFYGVHARAMEVIREWLRKAYPGKYRPAVSFVVSSVYDKGFDHRITVDCVAVRREPIDTGKVLRVPGAAVLPPMHKVYISGDAAQGSLMQVVAETLQSLEKCLQHCRLDWSHVVQLKTFLQPILLKSDVAREIHTYFGTRPVPVLTFVEWQSSDTVPMETELIAAVPPELGNQSGDTVEYLNPPHKPGGPVYSRIARVRSNRTIYTSSLYGEPSDADGQIHDIYRQLKKLVERGGGDLNHLVKGTYYVSDDATSKRFGEIRREYYDPQRPPAASKAKVADVGRAGKTISVDMIAVPKP